STSRAKARIPSPRQLVMSNDGATEGAAPATPPDEVNRLWQHGMHEEKLFHDRLNYFSFLETRSEEHTSELQSQSNLVCRLLLENTPSPSAPTPLSLHDALPI